MADMARVLIAYHYGDTFQYCYYNYLNGKIIIRWNIHGLGLLLSQAFQMPRKASAK